MSAIPKTVTRSRIAAKVTDIMQINFEDRVLILPVLLVCLYLVVAPVWYPSIAPRMYDNARLLQLALLGMLGLSMLLPPIRAVVAKAWCALGIIPKALIVLVLAGGAVSAAVSDAPKLGALEISLVIQLVLLFLCIFGAVRRLRDKAESVLAVAVCSGAALLVLKFWTTQILFMFEGKAFQWVSPFLDFANVRFFSQYQAYSLLLIPLAAALPGTARRWQVLVYLIAANYWALQWMVASRAVWIGLSLALISVLVLMRRGRIAWLGRQTLCVVAGGLIYVLFTLVTGQYAQVTASNSATTSVPGVNAAMKFGSQSDTDRIAMAEVSLEMLQQSPLLGVGPGQWGLHQSRVKNAHPHNTPLQLLSEYGIPAGLAGIALGAMLLVLAARTLRAGGAGTDDMVSASLCAALVMGLIDSLFSGNLIMPHSQIAFCVIAGWIVGRAPTPLMFGSQFKGSRLWAFGLAGTAILAACVIAVLAFIYVDVVSSESVNFSPRRPHFWQHGLFIDW